MLGKENKYQKERYAQCHIIIYKVKLNYIEYSIEI